ncbi:geranylgeranyl transferase type-1 subunit beta [Diaporthe australafricana]|uniref:Geranylgeranyl transferase type-1 subunit beta n=1 Tax=Diaporthe australafricana TaxID=127596 RepID=A0ABR3W6F0_9PEZI
MSSTSSPFDPPLDKPRHLRYWQRCARTLLPHHYTPNDSQRVTLGFFIIAAIDLLSSPDDPKPLLSPADRRGLRSWVLSCQHPHGGFCGSPTHVFPPGRDDSDAGGNANIAATYFALLLLPMLTEDGHAEGGAYAGVDRAKTLRWLRRLQRVDGDGSFGEVIYELPSFDSAGEKEDAGTERRRYIVGGGKDMRYCYLAATIRWILRGDVAETDDAYVEDIDVAALVRHIRRSQSYDGGFSESLGHESHAGYAYCSVAALALLDRPVGATAPEPEATDQQQTPFPHYSQSRSMQEGIPDIPGFISFLISRQFAFLEKEEQEADEDDEDPETANFQMASLSLSEPDQDMKHIGFNGRCNKVADTCYTWWVLGSLSILGVLNHASLSSSSSSPSSQSSNTVDQSALEAARKFLLDKTQHAIGGFGKRAANPPDIYHSSLGLFALATMGDPSLKKVDAGLAVSVDTVRRIEAGRRGLLRRAGQGKAGAGAKDGGTFAKSLVDMAVSMGSGGERPAWLEGTV